MKKYTPNQYVEIFDKLPMEIKDAVASSATTDHIAIVGKKHNLQIDKIGDLVDVTLDVMMGIVGTKDFVKELQDVLQINALEAAVLARDIDENIFKPIKETMTHLYAGKAPYRPSSSLVQLYEEDDDHPALSKDALLKEIEDPTPSPVKKETTNISLPSNQKPEIIKPNLSITPPQTSITEYHEELVNTEVKKEIPPKPEISPKEASIKKSLENIKIPDTILPPKEEPSASVHPNSSSILDQLASIKLSQAFVMPKGPEGIRELGKMQDEQKITAPIFEKPKVEEVKPQIPVTPKPIPTQTPEVPQKKIDPYREPI